MSSAAPSEEALRQAFATFDVDGSGAISKAELIAIFQFGNGPTSFSAEEAARTAAAIIRDFDQNGDGELQYAEFLAWKFPELANARARTGEDELLEEVGPGAAAPTDRAVEIQVLSLLDDALVEVLLTGGIRLLRSSWLLARPDGYRIARRQELEARKREGDSPLPTREEAAALVRRGDRSAAVFTYGCGSRPVTPIHEGRV